MDSALTISDIIAFIAIVSGVGGLWFRVESAVGKVRDDLAEYKTRVADDYVKSEKLTQFEERVIGEIQSLRASFEKFMSAQANRRRT